MKTTILALILTASAAHAETPNRTTMGWGEFLEASGCVVVDMGGYGNVRLASDVTDPCPASVLRAFWGGSSKQVINPGPDGTLGTDDDYSVAISDN